MTNRIILGNRGGSYGLFISRPGVDVSSATSPDDLIFSSSVSTWQIVQTGQVYLPAPSNQRDPVYETISYPDLGYNPTIFVLPHLNITDIGGYIGFMPWLNLWCEYLSATSCRIGIWQNQVGYQNYCTYGVLRLPGDG